MNAAAATSAGATSDAAATSAAAAALELSGVHAGYGDFQALFGVDLRVEPGEAVGVVGPNGAGKTTLLRVVSASQVYTDFGLFTAHPVILDDISDLFNFLTGYSHRRDYKELLVAPVSLRARLTALLQREMEHAREGRPAGVILKNNAVTDPGIIRELYRASQAGVPIDMIVRGACCLRPGVEGVSDRIRVRSIVGRFLEHSRIYYFANGGQEEVYIGSADLMERNLDRRVETLCRISEGAILRHIRDVVLDAYLRDNDRAYVLVDTDYEPVLRSDAEPRLSAQEYLMDWYTTSATNQDEVDRNA